MLNYAAAVNNSIADSSSNAASCSLRTGSSKAVAVLVTVGLASLLMALTAGSAAALDGIDLSSPAEATADGECPRLIQIKYPFLNCVNGQIGQSGADETWDNSRQIPMMTDWTEGDSAFGPDFSLVGE